MKNNTSNINFNMKQIDDASDEVYEAFFEEDESELTKAIQKLIGLLNEILKDNE